MPVATASLGSGVRHMTKNTLQTNDFTIYIHLKHSHVVCVHLEVTHVSTYTQPVGHMSVQTHNQ